MPPPESEDDDKCTGVVERVEKREFLRKKIKDRPWDVVEEMCLKVDKVGNDVVVIKKEVKKIRHSVGEMRSLVYVLHPEADPERTFADKVREQKYQIAGLLITGLVAVLVALAGAKVGW